MSEKIKDKANEVYDATKRAATKMGETLSEAGSVIKEKAGDALDATKDAGAKVGEKMVELKDKAAEGIEKAANKAQSG